MAPLIYLIGFFLSLVVWTIYILVDREYLLGLQSKVKGGEPLVIVMLEPLAIVWMFSLLWPLALLVATFYYPVKYLEKWFVSLDIENMPTIEIKRKTDTQREEDE